jgi:Protein of unknown function DUF72
MMRSRKHVVSVLPDAEIGSITVCHYIYAWNKAKPDAFNWYISHGFNSVEINASFYRFPAESWVKNWQSKSPQDFTFSISQSDLDGLKSVCN